MGRLKPVFQQLSQSQSRPKRLQASEIRRSKGRQIEGLSKRQNRSRRQRDLQLLEKGLRLRRQLRRANF